jgi:hypothetical protein
MRVRILAPILLCAAGGLAAAAAPEAVALEAVAFDAGAADAGAADAGAAGAGATEPAAARADAAVAGGPTDAGATADGPPPAPPPRAATVRLRAQVLEKGTRRPLAGASVSVDGTPAGDSGAEGRFEIRVAPGPHHLQAQLSGHEPADARVEAFDGASEAVIRLAPRLTGERYETTVRAAPLYPAVAVSGDEARQVAGSSGDPLRVIGSLPGVSQIVWPTALYVVRGANPGNTGFYLDGVRIPALFHLALGPSVIHPYLIGGVDFYPGGYPASYGGYVSGIVAARSAPPPTDRVHASADVTLYDAGGLVTAPFDDGRGTAVAAARYSYTGALFSLLATNSVLRYGDYQLRVDHPLGGGQATVFAFGSLDQVGWLDVNSLQNVYAQLQFNRLDARWRRTVGGGRLLAGITLGADWSQSTLFDRPIKVRVVGAAPRLVYDRGLSRFFDLQVGADGNLQAFATDVPDFQRRPSDLGRSRRASMQGTFATLAFHAGRLTIAPGLRGDLFVEEGAEVYALEPRLDVIYQLSETITLKADGGRFAQMPSLPVSVPGFEAFGLGDYGLQTSVGGSLGVERRLPIGLSLGLTGYLSRLRVTDVRDIDLTMLDPMAPDYLVSRRGYAYGAELMLRRADQGRLFGWLAYTLSWSLREDDGGVLGQSDWDQRHLLNLVAGYRLKGGISVGARFHYNTGRHAPIVGSGGEYRQLPAFYQIDLRAERRFVFDRFLFDLYADFANATATREVVQLVNEYDPMTGQPYVVEQSFRFILPTVGLHAQF